MKSCKSCLSFSCNLIGSFKQVLISDWLLCLIVKLSHKLALMRANQIARITHDFKMNVKDSELLLYMTF